MVGETQNAFVPGRMMIDNCYIAHETINSVKKRKKGGRFEAVLKVDLSKAYDRVRWDFIIGILTKMEFPQLWIQWITKCISTVSYAILVNGEPTAQIKPGTGLRQGDPLSPYLFILLMEVLSKKIMKLESQGILQGIKVSRNAPTISHLFFADDAIFCFKATPPSCRAIRGCIEDFCSISGEMINFDKSTVLFSPNTPRRFIRILRSPLGVRVKDEVGNYLGCPMDVDGRSSAKFQSIVDRINEKIGSWKFARTSQPGKLLLINSILVAMASHILSIYSCPSLIAKKINSNLLKFWWATSSSRKPIYWRKKELLYHHKGEGGVGIKEIGTLNLALLARQSWRMYSNPRLLASKLFKGKYGGDPISLGYRDTTPRSCSWAARSLIKASNSLKDGVRTRIGNGETTRITQDTWVGNSKLKMKNTSSNDVRQLTTVAHLMTTERRWNAPLIWRCFQEQEAKLIMATHIPSDCVQDTYQWEYTKNGKYTFKSGYWHIQSKTNAPPLGTDKFWANMWRSSLLPRWKHFIWKLIHRALPTKTNLCKRGIDIEVTCPFCKGQTETDLHIFRLCPTAQMVWRASPLGIVSESQAMVPMQTWLRNFLNLFFNQDGKDDSRAVQLTATLWAIWLHRNDIIFCGVSVNPNRILEVAQSHVHSWKEAQKAKLMQQQHLNWKQPGEINLTKISMWKVGKCSNLGFFSILVDAAWNRKKNSKQKQWEAAVAWAEDDNQTISCSGAKRIFAQDALQAECYAILEGIRVASGLARNVILKTDCKVAVEAIRNENQAHSHIATIISDIRKEATMLDFFVCLKVSRNAVIKAHNLAQQERKGLGL
ncbi:uncharacterized protein [Spinacia oleracea]|uniref:Reverse transcriptase domain-containing protein n=1 Tax=Spinacia oleracea TaxID=3562 RepID=A0A9R0IYP5_SPIOL|nr:uncharacterized protein LOC110797194 [Spinacia oleracea]